MAKAPNIWLATVRRNHTPHLVPIWFVWVDDKVYVCTGRHSVKARNIAANARVVFALEDGNDPVVVEADAKILDTAPEAVVAAFETKYQWRIHDDSSYDTVIEITPRRVVM
jgi:nitroimidazol reductase NimA-like FMN-containing flavoprotein (pyridoxamine 5'-phosphate oxidase superfamily)